MVKGLQVEWVVMRLLTSHLRKTDLCLNHMHAAAAAQLL